MKWTQARDRRAGCLHELIELFGNLNLSGLPCLSRRQGIAACAPEAVRKTTLLSDPWPGDTILPIHEGGVYSGVKEAPAPAFLVQDEGYLPEADAIGCACVPL